MTKTCVKISVVLVILMVSVLSTAAYADTFANFALRIDLLDASGNPTGVGAVVSYNSGLNMAPLFDPGIPGLLEWAGQLADPTNPGGFDSFNVVAAYSAPNGTTGADLSLSADVTRSNSQNAATIVMTLQDNGYQDTVPPTATLTQNVNGLATYSIFTAAGAVGSNTVSTSGTAQYGVFRTWVNNTAPDIATFGASGVYDGVSSSLNPLTLSIPMQYGVASPQLGNGGTDSQFNNTLNFNGQATYSIISQATLRFGTGSPGGNNDISFGMDSVVNKNQTFTGTVPEPTSLLLIGSGLIGFGVLRRKNGRAA